MCALCSTNAKLILKKKDTTQKRWLRKKRKETVVGRILFRRFSCRGIFCGRNSCIDSLHKFEKSKIEPTKYPECIGIVRLWYTNRHTWNSTFFGSESKGEAEKKTDKIGICSFSIFLIKIFGIDSKCDLECGNVTPPIIHRTHICWDSYEFQKHTYKTNLKGHKFVIWDYSSYKANILCWNSGNHTRKMKCNAHENPTILKMHEIASETIHFFFQCNTTTNWFALARITHILWKISTENQLEFFLVDSLSALLIEFQ